MTEIKPSEVKGTFHGDDMMRGGEWTVQYGVFTFRVYSATVRMNGENHKMYIIADAKHENRATFRQESTMGYMPLHSVAANVCCTQFVYNLLYGPNNWRKQHGYPARRYNSLFTYELREQHSIDSVGGDYAFCHKIVMGAMKASQKDSVKEGTENDT